MVGAEAFQLFFSRIDDNRRKKNSWRDQKGKKIAHELGGSNLEISKKKMIRLHQ